MSSALTCLLAHHALCAAQPCCLQLQGKRHLPRRQRLMVRLAGRLGCQGGGVLGVYERAKGAAWVLEYERNNYVCSGKSSLCCAARTDVPTSIQPPQRVRPGAHLRRLQAQARLLQAALRGAQSR